MTASPRLQVLIALCHSLCTRRWGTLIPATAVDRDCSGRSLAAAPPRNPGAGELLKHLLPL
jgi:hypothetical protein